MNLTREDVERIVRNILVEDLTELVKEAVTNNVQLFTVDEFGYCKISLNWAGEKFTSDEISIPDKNSDYN